ncbi:YihY/virulence factor BrkB family protein [Oceanicola sp. 22II-s10i]|uniref:YihY/virulence factor BrkB family protein n=1 Tax=Oceanicola sp. 22II-s10i TaxID=1317116 RepID=UPI000B5211F2|nr:YihY/virulence factor BrkB family protein [Oceanicola sp. 22II-s10i]
MTSNTNSESQQAAAPTGSRPQRWRKVVNGVWLQIGEANMGLVAAGVAFYAMFSVFPGLAAVIAIWGLMSDPNVLLEQLELVRNIVPAEVFALVETQILNLMSTSGDTLGWAGVLSLMVATWSARSGVAALMLGLNTIHGATNRFTVRHYLTALALTVALFAVTIIALSLVVVMPIVLKFIPLGTWTTILIAFIRWVAAIGFLLVGLALLYRFGPNRKGGEKVKWVTPGAVLAVALWGLASWGFSVYLTNFGRYNEVYGSIGAAIAMLMWLYVTAFVVLLGASMNVQIQRRPRRDKSQASRPQSLSPNSSSTAS